MLKLIACSLSFLFATAAFAVDAPDFTFDLKADQLTLTPPADHHFNTEAPMQISAGKIKLKPTKSEEKVTVRLSRAALKAPEVEASLYLCDNAKTYCVKKTEKFTLKSETGFIVNDPAKAFALAKEKNLPVMIDFFGVWCPPCNHLDALIFHDPAFQKAAEGKIVRLKMDIDRPTSRALTERYAIVSYPTILFTASDGDELFRILGFRELSLFERYINDAFQGRSEGYATLVKMAKAGDAKAAVRAAQIAMDSEKYDEANDLLKGAPVSELNYKVAVAKAKKAKNAEAQARAIQDWLKAYPETVEAVGLYNDLADLEEGLKHDDAKKQALRDGVAVTLKFLKMPPERLRVDTDFTEADLKEALADFYDGLGQGDLAKAAYQACAEAYAAEGRAEKSDFPRGPNLERGYCLSKLGHTAESEAIYREGIQRYPEEFTFHMRLARLLMDNRKDAKGAYAEVLEAVRTGYGGQRVRATLLEAKIADTLSDHAAMEKAVRDLDTEIKGDPQFHKDDLVEKKTQLEKRLKG